MDRTVDDEKVIADFVELVEIATLFAHLGRRHRGHFLVEDVIAQTLRLFDLGFGFRKPHFESAGHCQNGPLRKSCLKRAGLVNVDQATGSFWGGADSLSQLAGSRDRAILPE